MESFAAILSRAENPMAAAMMLLLSWIASCDGEISDDEFEALQSIAASGKSQANLSRVIEIARQGSIEDLQLGCEVLRQVTPEYRRLILEMAVSIALDDSVLTTAEGHIVRFIADVLNQSPGDLDEVFVEMTGQRFPPAADPSSVDWWQSQEKRKRERQSESASNSRSSTSPPHNTYDRPDMQRLRDLAMLGLDESASAAEIQEAYRRMAKVHHPDRFATLGPEAVRAAEISFRRIQSAYERLIFV